MADVLFVGGLVGFFVLAAFFVKGCDRVIGGARSASRIDPEPAETETEVAA